MPRIGEAVNKRSVKKGVPPIVFQIQPTGYIVLDKPEDLRQWEEDVKKFHGVAVKGAGAGGAPIHACETCSGGCTDDCGLV